MTARPDGSRPNADATRPDSGRASLLGDLDPGGGVTPPAPPPGVGPVPNEPGMPAERPCPNWIIFEEWHTAGDERVCPVCSPLDGLWFIRGEGPTPPLHGHCRCRRIEVWRECAERTAGGGGISNR